MIEPPFATEAENTAWRRGWSDAAHGTSNRAREELPELREAYRRGYDEFIRRGPRM